MVDQTPPGFPIEKMALPADCPECGSSTDQTSAHGRAGVGEKPDIGVLTVNEAQEDYGVVPELGDEVFWASVHGRCSASDCAWRAETVAATIATTKQTGLGR